jgi:hypothetical protein
MGRLKWRLARTFFCLKLATNKQVEGASFFA